MSPLEHGPLPGPDSAPTAVLPGGPRAVRPRPGGSSVVDLGGPAGAGSSGPYRHPVPEFRAILEDLLRHDPATAGRLRDAASLPDAGRQFHGFTLIRELGRGAFARVFLARQPAVADRPVAVKVVAENPGPAGSAADEVRALAQLQHTNIIPVYSAHAVGPALLVVMPYLGDHTLADVAAAARRAVPTSGAAVADLCRASAADGPPAAPAVETLRRLSYVDAVVWLAVRLADGLAFAHAHGIVHCDVKPANVLLTAAGEPMLLDFNVADDTKVRGGPAGVIVGGSVPYMSPEQLTAFHGRTGPVDHRCDLYAFGVVLYELLTGRPPFAGDRLRGYPSPLPPDVFDQVCRDRAGPPPRLRPFNPAVPPGLEAIVRKCLAADPAHRYQSAGDLLDDLRRQQDHRPLRVAGNPSVRERARKFARRHPAVMSGTGVAALAAGVIVALLAAAAGYRHQLAAAAERSAAAAALTAFRDEARAARYRLSGRADDLDQLRAGAALARTALSRYDALPPDDRVAVREAAGDLFLLLARGAALDTGGDRPARLAEAWRLNALAAACDPALADSPGLWAQRAGLAAARGDAAAAGDCRARAAALPLRTARDLTWRAGELAAQGRVRAALPLLRDAAAREPHNVWAWLELGNAYLDQGRADRAEGCYDVCVALWPDFPWAWYNRGLARLKQKDCAGAAADFTRCLELRPDMPEAHADRALAEQGRGRLAEAEADLTRALELGARQTRLYFLRARVRDKRGDAAGAAEDRAEGRRREPADEKSWVARGIDRLASDPEGALADFTAALRLNPRSVLALQNQAHVLAERLHRPAEAVAALDRAAELRPDAGDVLSGRGVVLARLGRFDDARRDAEAAVRADASPARRYQAGCVYALTSRDRPEDATKAVALLAGAVRDGYGHDLLATDADLAPLRGRPEFRQLAAAAAALRARAGSH